MVDKPSLAARIPATVDAYRFARHPRWEVACWRDYRQFASQWPALRRESNTANGAHVLITTYRDDIYEAKLAVYCALAVNAAGGRATFLVRHATHTRTRRYLKALDVGDVVVAQGDTRMALDDQSSRLLAHGDFDAVKEWQIGRYGPGKLVLSTLIREAESADGDIVDQRRDRLIELGALAARNYADAERWLDTIRPTHLVALETGYVTNGPLVDVAVDRAIPVIDIAACWRDDAVLLKRLSEGPGRRVVAASVDRQEFSSVVEPAWTPGDHAALDAEFTERYDGSWGMQRTFQAAGAELDTGLGELQLPDRPVAVIWAHVLWDATFWAGDDLFANYSDWLVQTVRSACANPNLTWLVKSHPANSFRSGRGDVRAAASEADLIEREIGSLPDHVRVLPADLKITALAFYRACDFGVTVRGTPGFEMAAFAKPVLTAGTGPFDRLGFTVDSDSIQQYQHRLATLHELSPLKEPEVERARRYALTLFRDRPFRFESVSQELRMTEGSTWDPLDRNLSAASCEKASDLVALGRWIVDSKDPDWLNMRDAT